MDTIVSRRKHSVVLAAACIIGIAPIGMRLVRYDVSQISFVLLGILLVIALLIFSRLQVEGYIPQRTPLTTAYLFVITAYLLFGFACCMPLSSGFFGWAQLISPFVALCFLCRGVVMIDVLHREEA